MPAIDLLFRTGLESERLHQLALVSLLRHTTLPELLVPGFGPATKVEWEPRGGTYDLSMTNATDRRVMLELKVDANLSDYQVANQIRLLEPPEDLAYILLGHARFTARPWLDRRLAELPVPPRSFVYDLNVLRSALTRLEVPTSTPEASDARDLATAYHHHLGELERRTDGFFDHPPSAWEGERWGYYYGFFDHCRRTIPCMEHATIAYVPNQTGGFRACHWQGTTAEPDVEAYLQFEDDRLCIKIYVENGVDRSAARDRLRERLMQVSAATGLEIQRPTRLGHGQTMTLGYLDAAQTGFGLRSEADRFARIITAAVDVLAQLAQPPSP